MEDLGPVSAMPFLVHDVGARRDGGGVDDDPQTQFSIATQSFLTTTIGMLHRHRCFETPQGWILSLDPVSHATFLWRPEHGGRCSLPAMEEDFPRNCKCLLSGKPTAANRAAAAVVVVLNLDGNDYWICRVMGGTRWERHGYVLTICDAAGKPSEWHMARRHGVAAVGGKLYYEFPGHALGVVDLDHLDADGEPRLTYIDVGVVDDDTSDGGGAALMWSSSYLVESRDELFLAVISLDGHGGTHMGVAEVAVYRMDFAAQAWRRVDGVGDDRVFLLGGGRAGVSNFGASCSAAEHGLRGNRIYFVNHVAGEEEESYLHVIDMADESEVVQRPFEGFPPPLRPPLWMFLADS